jgi:16S rRNA (cytosine1402-N4)-methyltransferase
MRSPSTGQVEDPFSARFHPGRSGRHPDGVSPVGGLRMSQRFEHVPVMVDEVVDLLRSVPAGTVVDATVGGGGHASAVLAARSDLDVVGIDQDPDALAAAGETLGRFGERVSLHRARFDAIVEVVRGHGRNTIAGALFDLGVSSPQVDRPERGFSYRADAPLDMRMDPAGETTAADVVNSWPAEELARLFAGHGEGRLSGRIARAVVAARPIATTGELVDVVAAAVPAAVRRRGNPAKRVFQALRVAVNRELDVLGPALDDAISLLAPGGRCVAIAYHSGEDRIVKDRFRAAATGGCTCPPGLPCACGAQPTVRLLNRGARKPTSEEIGRNRRAESARLRAVERIRA